MQLSRSTTREDLAMITALDKLLTPADVVALQFRRRNRVLRDINSPVQQSMLNADREASLPNYRYQNSVELGYRGLRRRIRVLIKYHLENGLDLDPLAIY